MYTYRSKCRWNMLLHVKNEIIEIRPGELFESDVTIQSRHLELISEKEKLIRVKKKSSSKKKTFNKLIEKKSINATPSSST